MTKHQTSSIAKSLKFEYLNARSMEARCAVRSCMIGVANSLKETSPSFRRNDFLYHAGHPEYATGRFVRLSDEDMKKHDNDYFGIEI